MDYRYDSHTVFQIEYYLLVWVTKYRCKVLTWRSRDLST